LCGIKARTRTERSEKHLGWGHTFIKAAILGGLVAYDNVLTSLDFKLNATQVFDRNLHAFLRQA
jgi:hypothetical protein